ncbi:SAM-dependent methyltransferase [Lichenicoccus sp.]|uniref:SAM-dependent methyltransferase n=1 Tax=Lichenicoccus sp. TaxID=2781899 RepID=UPI003D0C32B7
MTGASWDRTVFDRLYADDPDPWKFETSAYEQAKYADTLAQLDRRQFESGLELGCSIGVMTLALAGRCRSLLAVDLAEAALVRARMRCDGLTANRVSFRCAMLPREWNWPELRFDLILVSELLYFLSPADNAALAGHCIAQSEPGCIVLLVNWTGPTDTPCTGDAAAELFAAACIEAGFRRSAPLLRDGYRLDRLERPPPPREP